LQYEDGVEPDERFNDAITRGVALARAQGYDVEGITFIIKKPMKRYPDGATAGIQEEDRTIGMAVDEVSPDFDLLVPLTVHEINHLEREKHSLIGTLEEVLVSEGLAQMAERKTGLSKTTAAYFQSVTDRETTIGLLKGDFNRPLFGTDKDPERDFDHYFFGGKGGLPKRAGYALGLEIVKSFMDATGKTLQQATKMPASEIVDCWRNNKSFIP